MKEAPSLTPFLVTAVMDYCRQHGFTPYIAVAVDDACQVPRAYVQNNQIVFDVSDEATHLFSVDEKRLTFQARFGADNHIETIVVPTNRLMAALPMEAPERAVQFEVTPSDLEPSPTDAPAVRRPMRVK